MGVASFIISMAASGNSSAPVVGHVKTPDAHLVRGTVAAPVFQQFS
jgi:hypothetical protein